jgi:DNA-binding response OmpR family regulator
VLTAADGDAAWKSIKAAPPDMVLLDLMLPGMDGMELCRMIREDPRTTDMPIIVATGRGRLVDQVGGLDGGADDYLVKPFNPRELLARIDGLFRRCEKDPPPGKNPSERRADQQEVVLIVDDEPKVREVLARLVQAGRPGCLVAEASDVPEAKKLLTDLRPDLVISDVRLPNGSGMDLCRFISGHPWLYKTRILVITGYPSVAVRDEVFVDGASEFMPKPFQAQELLSSVDRLLA